MVKTRDGQGDTTAVHYIMYTFINGISAAQYIPRIHMYTSREDKDENRMAISDGFELG